MAYCAYEYTKEYGDRPFSELPFNDADNCVLNASAYMPIEKVLTRDFEPVPEKNLGKAAEDLFALFGNRTVAPGLVLNKQFAEQFYSLKDAPRFSGIPITGARREFDVETKLQFAAFTFLLGDDTMLILYRGTDDSMTGWIEDLEMLAKDSIASYKPALEYLNDAAAAFPDRKIILTGHSKGAHLALFVALNCSDEIRGRIIRLYNNDGPGFKDYACYDSDAYRSLLPVYRHIVPENSIIGMMLAHDSDYVVVKSSKPAGLMQHDINTWMFKGPELDTVPEIGSMAKLMDRTFANMIENMDLEHIMAFYDTLIAIDKEVAQPGLMGVTRNIGSTMIGAAKAMRGQSREQRRKTGESIGKFGRLIVSSGVELGRERQAERRAEAEAKREAAKKEAEAKEEAPDEEPAQQDEAPADETPADEA